MTPKIPMSEVEHCARWICSLGTLRFSRKGFRSLSILGTFYGLGGNKNKNEATSAYIIYLWSYYKSVNNLETETLPNSSANFTRRRGGTRTQGSCPITQLRGQAMEAKFKPGICKKHLSFLWQRRKITWDPIKKLFTWLGIYTAEEEQNHCWFRIWCAHSSAFEKFPCAHLWNRYRDTAGIRVTALAMLPVYRFQSDWAFFKPLLGTEKKWLFLKILPSLFLECKLEMHCPGHRDYG